mmetsp:Transcript_58805/g.141075  ORF Transcript_58805/g.141075 Transcript_58805/m.141075 type:complete len:261 (-) Transcript_58805:2-784(-)
MSGSFAPPVVMGLLSARASAAATFLAAMSFFFLSCDRLSLKNSSLSSSSSSLLMYSTVLAMRGMTTLSRALTRRLVTLIASSRMTKEVCSVASCTSTSTAFEKTVRALAICCPPLDSPVWSAPPPAVSTALNTGTLTPAMLSTLISTFFCATPTLSMTVGLMSPAAYLTSARAKLPSRKAEPMSSFALRMFRSSSRRRMVSASAFFLSRLWPFLAPTSLTFMTCRFCRVGKTFNLAPAPLIPPLRRQRRAETRCASLARL